MLVLRLLVLLLVGFTLFSDEQERFICNTIQPGCSNVCFDIFNPVSLLRLWLMHLILLCVPHLMFAVYVVQKVMAFDYLGGFSSIGSRGSSSFTLESSSREASLHKAPLHDLPHEWGVPRFYCAYLLVVILQILLEAVFSGSQFYLFGSTIPKSFLCYETPCTSGVECYISRPTEKNLMLNFMLCVSTLSIVLSSADLVSSVRAAARRRRKNEPLMEEMSKGEQSSMLTATTVMEETGVVLTKRNSPTANGFKDKRSVDTGRSGDLLNEKLEGEPAPKTCEPHQERSINYSVLKLQRTETPMGVKKAGLYSSCGANAGHQAVLQDKKAWV